MTDTNTLPVSIEEFAAYLDGNLSSSEMDQFDTLFANSPGMQELIAMSDIVDQDIQDYLSDEFSYEADMTALEDSNFDIPDIEVPVALHEEETPTDSELPTATNEIVTGNVIADIETPEVRLYTPNPEDEIQNDNAGFIDDSMEIDNELHNNSLDGTDLQTNEIFF